MASIMCQGLQSCLEPRLIEPRVLRPKLAPPRPNSPKEDLQNEEENENNKNGELGGWSFIKALTNTPQNHDEVTETEKVYVHPLFKSSSSTLSEKSLEMCTESLGSETGSDISESSDEFSVENEKSNPIPSSKSRELGRKLSRAGGNSFPPPLTSISGSDSVKVRPHREGGRLVMKAVTVSSGNGYFQAERGGGRLRLCLLKDSSINCNNEEVYDDGDDGDEGHNGNDEDDSKWVEGMGENSGNVRGEIEICELPCCRPSRCKESRHRNNKGISNWRQFWVAIS